MEKLIIPEQDIINSVCLYMADKKRTAPEEIEVELMFDDEAYGFSAEIYFNGRNQIITHRDLIEAIRFWLEHQLNRNPYSGIELVLDDEEGIIAYVQQ
ncbi:YxcD family protein [Bacillus sp. JJ722]|uniref:YxcD family protein n=1 Tax=Bacillus sp. JJ722 TaxID=3122973 RepID=UPI003000AE51